MTTAHTVPTSTPRNSGDTCLVGRHGGAFVDASFIAADRGDGLRWHLAGPDRLVTEDRVGGRLFRTYERTFSDGSPAPQRA